MEPEPPLAEWAEEKWEPPEPWLARELVKRESVVFLYPYFVWTKENGPIPPDRSE